MLFEELLAVAAISLAIGFFLGYWYIRPRLISIEEKYRAELERWKAETESGIRKDSVNRSRSTLKGKIAEQIAPVLPEFSFNPADARFIGSPVDYIIFDGLTEVADEKASSIRIVFMDVKHGKGSLTRTQRVIRQAVLEKSVAWETLHLPEVKQLDADGKRNG